MRGINQHLKVKVCTDADDAVKQGYDYAAWPKPPKPLGIKEAVVVLRGTRAGRSTVDFILTDEEGNEYVTMITAALLRVLPLEEEPSGFDTLPDDFELGDY